MSCSSTAMNLFLYEQVMDWNEAWVWWCVELLILVMLHLRVSLMVQIEFTFSWDSIEEWLNQTWIWLLVVYLTSLRFVWATWTSLIQLKREQNCCNDDFNCERWGGEVSYWMFHVKLTARLDVVVKNNNQCNEDVSLAMTEVFSRYINGRLLL